MHNIIPVPDPLEARILRDLYADSVLARFI
jgi:hypothetical protein